MEQNEKTPENKSEKNIREIFSLKDKSKLYGALIGIYSMIIILLGIASTMLIPVVENKKLGISIITSMAVPLSAMLFVLSNIISEIFGKKKAIFALGFSYLLGIFVSFWLFLGWIILRKLSINNFYLDQNNHYFPFDALGPSWRFFVAGLIAFTISTIVNTGIIWSMKKRNGDKKMTLRLYLSSLIGQAVDNIVFSIIAFAPLKITPVEFNWQTLFCLAAFEWGIEVIIEGILTYPTHLIIKKIQKVGLYEELNGEVIYHDVKK